MQKYNFFLISQTFFEKNLIYFFWGTIIENYLPQKDAKDNTLSYPNPNLLQKIFKPNNTRTSPLKRVQK